MSNPNLSSFIWSVADLLRGDYKQSEYGKVILPFTVLRRLDCVLEATKPAVLAELAKREKAGLNPEPFLLRKSGQLFYNISPLDLKKLMGDQDHIGENLRAYMHAFSPAVRDIFESFDFHTQIDRLTKSGLLYLVTEKFATIDLHPDAVSNAQMGAVFEELIRKFAELSNETAGEHFTPREVIRLMVNLLFIEDDDALTKPGVVRSIYDPAAGTGGMLSVAGEHLASLNPDARLVMYGQELNPESYAICKADMLIKGQDIANIIFGNTLSDDGLPGKQFDYMLSNPPFGVEWKKIEKEIRKEAALRGFNGRFGPGLPRVSDGSLLFLLHLISKMRQGRWMAAVKLWHRSQWQARCSPEARDTGESGDRAATCWRTTCAEAIHRPAGRHVLQHWHAARMSGSSATGNRPRGRARLRDPHRRQQLLAEDAKELGEQTVRNSARSTSRTSLGSFGACDEVTRITACPSAAIFKNE